MPPDSLKISHSKITDIEDLARYAEECRAVGKSVALAHGAFDVLHIGHVRYLKAAKKLADVLFVTVTGDKFINKGPGRPVFRDVLRAEMLAALIYVDRVAIHHAPSAENLIDAIRPDFYVKGQDYANPEDDITGCIVSERKMVEKHGGELVITDEINFSSSVIINRHLKIRAPEIETALERYRSDFGIDAMIEPITESEGIKVLVVGETILDEYEYVTPTGKPPKEHIIATRSNGSEVFAGGAVAAANHIAGICSNVTLVTSLGEHADDLKFVQANLRPNVELAHITCHDRETIRKKRLVDPNWITKLFEVQYIDDRPIPENAEKKLNNIIASKAPHFDVVVITDFGHGMISPETVETLVQHAPLLAVNTQSNSSNQGYNLITKYPRADYVCIDEPEFRLAACDQHADFDRLVHDRLGKLIDCPRFAITRGKKGVATYDLQHLEHMPAFSDQVVDTIGAGDAFLAITGPLIATGVDLRRIGFIGNVAGAIKVGYVGHSQYIDKPALVKAITGLLK